MTKSGTANQDLIEELEGAIAGKGIGPRAEMLRRVTDLFAAGAAGFDGEQVALFGEIMGRLVDDAGAPARAQMAERLAGIANAPPTIIRALALDGSIDVAGPVLARSDRVDEETLVISAKTKSQDHLLAISRRGVLGEAVTDVLVERGNPAVAISVAENPGARFSEFGYTTLVARSEGDEELAVRVWLRPEMPRQHVLKLLATASAAVQRRLEAADRRKAKLFQDLVGQARDRIQALARERSAEYAAANSTIRSLHEAGELAERHLLAFAQTRKFDETVITLSLLCDLPVGLVERAIVQDRFEQVLILGKAIGLAWETVWALLQMRAENGQAGSPDAEQCSAGFARLQPETAKKAIQFYRLRERTVRPSSAMHSELTD
jgi:uncharacterized protein (DUF2336 family)